MIKCCITALALLLQLSLSCQAQELESAKGRVILTVSGAIGAAYGKDSSDDEGQRSADFDLAMLEALGLTKVATDTPWTEGIVEFEGVLIRDLLKLVEAGGDSVRAVALDNYVVRLPVSDFLKYDVIIATRIDGEPIAIRDSGPLWIIYPWNDFSELRRPQYYARSSWQLRSLTVLP